MRLNYLLRNYINEIYQIIVCDSVCLYISCLKSFYAFLEQRDYIIFLLLFATGLRASELLELKITGINQEKIIVIGKGKVVREVPLSKFVFIELNNYILNIRIKLKPKSDYLILNHLGEQLTYNGLYYIFKKRFKNKITPHTLRHSFATNLLDNGMNIREIQCLLGHKNLNTTEIYTKVSKTKLKNEYLKSVVRQEDL